MLILNYQPGCDPAHLVQIAESSLRGGVNWLMLRVRNLPAAFCLDLALELRRLTRQHNALFGVNPFPALAEWSGADALHLPEHAPYHPPPAGALLGRSVHSVEVARQAAAEGCHYLLVGTMYPTRSHPEKPPEGLAMLQAIHQAVALPLIAIGGITPERVAECLQAGACGVAVVSGIAEAPDVEAAAHRYRQALDAPAKASLACR
jgi:thiamine-phosphate diphosphorylase